MKKLLSSLLALMLLLSSCVLFAKESSNIAVVVLDSCHAVDYRWTYTIDKENMLDCIFYEYMEFRGASAGYFPAHGSDELHFKALKEGDVTITFVSSSYKDGLREEPIASRTLVYTYHVDSNLNIELVSLVEV